MQINHQISKNNVCKVSVLVLGWTRDHQNLAHFPRSTHGIILFKQHSAVEHQSEQQNVFKSFKSFEILKI